MGSAQSVSGNKPYLLAKVPSSHIYELEEDIKWKEEIRSGIDLHDTLPEDATGEDVVWRIRGGNRDPWKDVAPPKEDNLNPDLYETDNATSDSLSTSTSVMHQKQLQLMQYMTHWDERHKGWSLILEEKGQPVKPITGGFAGAMKNTRFDQWKREDSKPLIARCPGGTSNPGGWVRGAHSLPRSGRHYWEVQYIHPPKLPGKPLEGTFMTGLFSNLRTSYDWNSGISHFWGIGNGKWRRKDAQAVVIEGGSVRNMDFDHEYDLEDDILNEEGVVHGHGDKVGVLVDMDEGWLAFFRNGKPVAGIPPSSFPSLEYDWWPCCRPFAPGCRAILDCHCSVPQEALDMEAPEDYDSSDDSDSDSDESDSEYSDTNSSSNSSAADEKFYAK